MEAVNRGFKYQRVPRGRCDLAAATIAEVVVKQKLEPAAGMNLWDGPGGLGEVTQKAIEQIGIPTIPITPLLILQKLGLLK